jgi:hypothetical protein
MIVAGRKVSKLIPVFQFPLWDTENAVQKGKISWKTFNSLYGIQNKEKNIKSLIDILSIPFMGYIQIAMLYIIQTIIDLLSIPFMGYQHIRYKEAIDPFAKFQSFNSLYGIPYIW